MARIEIGKKTEILDVLINNAGINGGWPQAALEASIDQFKQVFETNVYGVARVTQAFIDLLRKSPQPRIVNVFFKWLFRLPCIATLLGNITHTRPQFIQHQRQL